jgi:hypothetical protein
MLYETRLFPEVECTFKHALTHDVAYGSLLQDRRKTLHADIVAAIQRLYPDRLDEHVERLAHHALAGDLWERAVSYCHRAGRRAQSRSAAREAGQWFEQALAALRHLPDSREHLEQSIDIRIDFRNMPDRVDYLKHTYDLLVHAERYAEQIGDQPRLGRVLVSMNGFLASGVISTAPSRSVDVLWRLARKSATRFYRLPRITTSVRTITQLATTDVQYRISNRLCRI